MSDQNGHGGSEVYLGLKARMVPQVLLHFHALSFATGLG